jgi:hypothetical protein
MKEKEKRMEAKRNVCVTSCVFTILNYITMLSIYREIRSDEQVNLK